jgi:hypothetical protein
MITLFPLTRPTHVLTSVLSRQMGEQSLSKQISLCVIPQGQGTASGFQWEPSTLEPQLIKPAVVRYVARILGRMASMSQPGATSACNVTNNYFASPKLQCAFTIDWDFIAGLMGDRFV